MQLRTQISLIIAVAVIVWAVALLLQGASLSWSMLAPFGATVTFVTLGALGFIKFAWRWKLFRGWLVERPDLNGTWRCQLLSNFTKDGKPIEKYVYVVIRQTLVSLSLRLYSDQARSVSIADNLARDGTDLFCLTIAYQNVPKLEQRGTESEIHYGASYFAHIDYDSETLEGHYWTDRNTRGSVKLFDRKVETVSSFEDAQRLHGKG